LILLLWALGAMQALLEANIAAELATALPRSGGFYIYAQRAFGDVGGLIVGWTVWISRLASTAALSVAFANFLSLLYPSLVAHEAVVAVAMQVVIYAINILGLREGSIIQKTTSLIKALALAAFCVIALIVAKPAFPTTIMPVIPAITFMGIVGAYQLIAGAYSGWYEPVFFSEENTNPGRNLPRAMFIGIALGAGLYLAVNAALLYSLGPAGVARTSLPFTLVLNQLGGTLPGSLFAIAAMISVASCANGGIMSASRVLLALSRDRLLPVQFAEVNKGGSPWVSYIVTAVLTIILALSGSFALLFGLIGTLNAGSAVLCITAIFVLRRREPNLPRPYKAYGYPWLPALALVIDAVLLVLFLASNWLGGVYASALWLLCIPFAYIARRARNQAAR
jgi:APA family basic amino acid/polyamine antiporter